MLARKNLLEDRARFLVALAGITFAVCLVTIQTGIYNGFVKSSGIIIDDSSADVWLSSKEMLNVEIAFPMPYGALRAVRKLHSVASAEALIIRAAIWRNGENAIEPIRVVGVDPDGALFASKNISRADALKLKAPDTAIVDAANLKALGITGVGGHGTIDNRDVRIVALTHGTQPIISATFVFTSLESAKVYLSPPTLKGEPPPPRVSLKDRDLISYVLVKMRRYMDPALMKQLLEGTIPNSQGYTAAEMAQHTRSYWLGRTGVGFILSLGALVGIFVGMVVVGQILYTSVSEHIKEYGTLKAMGASDWLFYRLIAMQAVIIAATGFIAGTVLCLWLAWWTSTHRNTLILITPVTALEVFAVTLAMCTIAGLFAIHRVTSVDPAIVFKA
ncbi:MAG TPA: FtsX-like permease family protein [Candidatus Tumulicola sp.]|nr:FtsX-like permease family protein [Candidatus Tumulicola sp.]